MARKRNSSNGAGRPRSPGNSTIATGGRLLTIVASFEGPATLTRIAEASDMLPSRAYRYLRGLCDAGFLEQESSSGRYDLGPEAKLFEPVGCSKCAHIGYRGRLPLFEFKRVGHALRETILRDPSVNALEAAAASTHPGTLLDDGICKVRAGETSLEEVMRVVH